MAEVQVEPKPYVAIVGSRDVPEIILEYFIRLGRTLTDLGVAISSGDAYGSDRAGWYGAKQSRRYNEIGARIYLSKNGKNGRWLGPQLPFFYNGKDFPETWLTAKAMAFEAREGFGGLYDSGIDLHTRNVYQIHGHGLDALVDAVFLYAAPDGKKKVSGGTNTAYQLAKKAGVPVIKNLYLQEDLEYVKDWLSKHELDYPYIDIDWREIHDPKDSRLLDFG